MTGNIPFQAARTRNVSGQETCEWCENGLAVAARRPSDNPDRAYAEYAPCPWCEKGAALEFPAGKRTRPRWGKQGYWQGRTPVVERRPEDGIPLSRAENAIRWRLMLRRMAGEDVDPSAGCDIADTRERLAVLTAEAKK